MRKIKERLRKIILVLVSLLSIGFTVSEWSNILCSSIIKAEVERIEERTIKTSNHRNSTESKIYVRYKNKDGVEESNYIILNSYLITNNKIKMLYNAHKDEIYPLSKISTTLLITLITSPIVLATPLVFVKRPFVLKNKFINFELL